MLSVNRAIIGVLLSLLCCSSVALAQAPGGAKHEQTHFALEEPFERSVPLPPSVLKILRADKSNREGFEGCPGRGAEKEIPASWFVASEATLKRGESPGLVVRAENGCLWGANIGPFWVFRRVNGRYELVLSQSALGLELLNTRTNGYRDIETCAAVAAGRYLVCLKYKFANGKYRFASRHEEENK
jgi:hypothetical protein